MDLAPDFKDLLEELARAAVEFVIVGGYAVAFHGRPRATKDIDIVLTGGPDNLGRASLALARFGAPANVVAAIRAMSAGDVVYLGRPPLRVDFLRSIEGVDAAGLHERAVSAELDGVPVRVIALDDLIANKRSVGRPQDLIDAGFLDRVRSRRTP